MVFKNCLIFIFVFWGTLLFGCLYMYWSSHRQSRDVHIFWCSEFWCIGILEEKKKKLIHTSFSFLLLINLSFFLVTAGSFVALTLMNKAPEKVTKPIPVDVSFKKNKPKCNEGYVKKNKLPLAVYNSACIGIGYVDFCFVGLLYMKCCQSVRL